MKRVYCLYRVSSAGKNEENDIPMQKIACRTFAEEQGWEIVREFIENGVSGYKLTLNERDALRIIREDACLRKFDILLVFMFDRIGRRDDETPFVVEYLVNNGVSVWSVCEGEQRFDNHVDKLTNYIRYWQASGESEKISERTRTRIRQLTEEGFFTGGYNAYGYDLVRRERLNKKNVPTCELQINEQEAEVVRLIFNKAIKEGYGPQRIANYLNQQHILTRKQKSWNQASISNILKNRLYTGVLSKGNMESKAMKHMQIINTETFAAAQEIRQIRNKRHDVAEKTIPRSTRGTMLLSGFLFCGHCGARMNGSLSQHTYVRKDGSVNPKQYYRYRCNRSIDGVQCKCYGPLTYVSKKVDTIFETSILALLEKLSEYSVEKIAEAKYKISIAGIQDRYKTITEQLATAENEICAIHAEMTASLVGKSKFSIEILNTIEKSGKQKASALKAEQSEAEAELADSDALRREIQYRCSKYQGILDEYQTATLEAKKMLLSQLVHRIELRSNYAISIELNPRFEDFVEGLIDPPVASSHKEC